MQVKKFTAFIDHLVHKYMLLVTTQGSFFLTAVMGYVSLFECLYLLGLSCT